MNKTQLFPLIGFLLGWGAPAGAMALRFLGSGGLTDPYGFLVRDWSQNSFFYWYMLSGTCLVLTLTGYLLARASGE